VPGSMLPQVTGSLARLKVKSRILEQMGKLYKLAIDSKLGVVKGGPKMGDGEYQKRGTALAIW